MANEPCASFAVLRTPLLPTDAWFAWSDGLRYRTEAAASGSIAAALQFDLALLRRRLRQWAALPAVREAVLVASPSLDESLDDWLRGDPETPSPRVERALIRYFSRMCTRPTPFGLFAGCTFSDVGARTALMLAPMSGYQRRTLMDAGVAFEWLSVQLRQATTSADVRFVPNSTLSRSPDSFDTCASIASIAHGRSPWRRSSLTSRSRWPCAWRPKG
jgi:hypothetical protein